MPAEAGDSEVPEFDWTAAAEGHATPPENVRYEVSYEDDGEVRKETISAWMYNIGLGEHALVTFWDQQRPVASFHTRYVRQIRIVPEEDAT